MAFIGEEAFVGGLRAYFRDHAWGNTVLDDLMSAFGEAAGDRPDRLDGRLARPGRHRHAAARPTARSTPSPPTTRRRGPTSSTVASYDAAGETLVPVATTDVRLDDVVTPVDLPRGRPPPGQRRRQHLRGGPPRRGLAAHHARPAGRPARAALARARRRHDQPAAAARRARAARGRRGRDPARSRTERNPSLVEPFLSVAASIADRWAAAGRLPRPQGGRSPTAPCCSPRCPSTGSRRCAPSPPPRPPTPTGRSWTRPSPRPTTSTWRGGRRRGTRSSRRTTTTRSSGCSPRTPTPRPTSSGCVRSRPRPEVAAKEQVWQAMFVDHSVPAGRDTLDARRDLLAAHPGRAAPAVRPALPRGAAAAHRRPAPAGPA